MKMLMFLAALAVVGLVVTGAIKLQKSSDKTISIQIDKDIVKEDGERVIQEGKHLFDEASSALRDNDESKRN